MAFQASDFPNFDSTRIGFTSTRQMVDALNRISDADWHRLRSPTGIPPERHPREAEGFFRAPYCIVIGINTLFQINDKKTTITLLPYTHTITQLTEAGGGVKIALVAKRGAMDRLMRIAVASLINLGLTLDMFYFVHDRDDCSYTERRDLLSISVDPNGPADYLHEYCLEYLRYEKLKDQIDISTHIRMPLVFLLNEAKQSYKDRSGIYYPHLSHMQSALLKPCLTIEVSANDLQSEHTVSYIFQQLTEASATWECYAATEDGGVTAGNSGFYRGCDVLQRCIPFDLLRLDTGHLPQAAHGYPVNVPMAFGNNSVGGVHVFLPAPPTEPAGQPLNRFNPHGLWSNTGDFPNLTCIPVFVPNEIERTLVPEDFHPESVQSIYGLVWAPPPPVYGSAPFQEFVLADQDLIDFPMRRPPLCQRTTESPPPGWYSTEPSGIPHNAYFCLNPWCLHPIRGSGKGNHLKQDDFVCSDDCADFCRWEEILKTDQSGEFYINSEKFNDMVLLIARTRYNSAAAAYHARLPTAVSPMHRPLINKPFVLQAINTLVQSGYILRPQIALCATGVFQGQSTFSGVLEITITRDALPHQPAAPRYGETWPPPLGDNDDTIVRLEPMPIGVGSRILVGDWDNINARSTKDLRFELVKRFLAAVPEMIRTIHGDHFARDFVLQTTGERYLVHDIDRDWVRYPKPAHFPIFSHF